METMQPGEEAPGEGQVVTTVELTPMCSPHTRPGRPSPTAQVRREFTELHASGRADLAIWRLDAMHCNCRWQMSSFAQKVSLFKGHLSRFCRQVLSEQVGSLVQRLVDRRQLCIAEGKAAWLAYLDIYVLDAGGRRKLVLHFGVVMLSAGLCRHVAPAVTPPVVCTVDCSSPGRRPGWRNGDAHAP